jgi:hypothetical protein
MKRDDDRCDGPLVKIGHTDKGIPIWMCEECRIEVDGYNHLKPERRGILWTL